MDSAQSQTNYKVLIRNFVVELIVYSGLVTIYYLLVLRFLSSLLKLLFDQHLSVYAPVALVLIVAQGVLLERLTALLLKRLGLKRLE